MSLHIYVFFSDNIHEPYFFLVLIFNKITKGKTMENIINLCDNWLSRLINMGKINDNMSLATIGIKIKLFNGFFLTNFFLEDN